MGIAASFGSDEDSKFATIAPRGFSAFVFSDSSS